MNKTRREQIDALLLRLSMLVTDIENFRTDVEAVQSDEQDAFDDMPSSFQDGTRGEAMQQAIDHLTDAVDCCDSILSELDSLDVALNEAKA